MEKATQFLKKITEKDQVIIVFNNDGDGICSCALIKKYLETKRCSPLIISQPMPPEQNLLRKIQTTVPTKIIFLDMAIDQDQGFMKKLGNLCDILIVDHHQITKNMNSSHIVHINPRIKEKKIYQSTTYLAYKIVSEIMNPEELLWIAAIGMISDYNLDFSKDVVDKIRDKYDIKGKMYDTHFGRMADMLSAAKATKALSMEQLVELIMEIKDPFNFDDIKNADVLMKAYQEVENELVRIKGEFDTKIEEIGYIVFYKYESDYNLRASVSTSLSERHKNRAVVVYEKVASWIDVSARCQSGKFNMGKILSTAADGLKASAGGHEAAAGAKVAEKDWEEFRARLEELINH